MPKYSLVIPIYNEESTIPVLYQRVSAVMDKLDGASELIFIDDGSQDHTLDLLRELHVRDNRVVYLRLARNFGHQIAVSAGLNYVQGDAIIILDADLQHPPELIPELVKLWEKGYHIVYTQQLTKRVHESWFKQLCSYGFYRIIKKIANIDMLINTGDFCLMDRQIVDLLNQMPERHRYIRGLRSWVGFNQIAVDFERDIRFAGRVKYTFSKRLALAINGLVSFSSIPLQFSTYLGFFSAVLAMGMTCYVLYQRMFIPNSIVTDFAMIAIAIFFLGAVQLISIGILGEYIGRIYEEVKHRPLYTISEIGRK
jgi:polyisoprenyl-phosphate glycosyltransferase